MSFWGVVVKPGKSHAFVPPPEDWNLHLSQAALEPTVPEGQRVAITVKTEPDEDPIILCTLTSGRNDTAALDLFFSQYSEFSVVGEHAVHLTGYYTPSQDIDDDEDDEGEEDEEYEPHELGFPGHPGMEGDDLDDEEDEDEDEDEDDDDEDEDEDEDDEDDLEGDLDEEMFGYPVLSGARRKKPSVVIEELDGEGKPKQEEKGKGKGGKAAANGKKAGKDEDEEMEDGNADLDSDGDEDEGEGEGEEESEEEEDTPPQKGAKQPAAAPPTGSKRPAETPAAANGAAKAQQPANKKQAVGQEQPQPAAKGKDAKQQKETKPEPKPQQKQEPKQQEAKQKQEAKPQEVKAAKKNIRRHPNGFEVEDVSFGAPHAKLAKPGGKVHVRYTGRLKSNGKVFDKSGNKPFQFRLGVGEVIKGWDLGVEGMRVGDKRRLVIPPQLAYGTSGVKGTIPPNATLEFDVELVDVK